MTWLVICVVLLAAFGPVLWLVPSRRDRRLSALREAARKSGMTVELRQIPKTNPSAADRVTAGGKVREPTTSCAAYSRVMATRLKVLPVWRLLSTNGESDGPRPGWLFEPAPGVASEHLAQMLECVDPLFDELPADIVGVEVTANSIVLFWLEGPAANAAVVTDLARLMDELETRLSALEQDLDVGFSDEDS